MKYLNQFHAWGLKTSYFGLNNYMWLLFPSIIVFSLIYFLFPKRKSKKVKR